MHVMEGPRTALYMVRVQTNLFSERWPNINYCAFAFFLCVLFLFHVAF